MPSCALSEYSNSTSTATNPTCGNRSDAATKVGQKRRESGQRRCTKSARTGPPDRSRLLNSAALLRTVRGRAAVPLPAACWGDSGAPAMHVSAAEAECATRATINSDAIAPGF